MKLRIYPQRFLQTSARATAGGRTSIQALIASMNFGWIGAISRC